MEREIYCCGRDGWATYRIATFDKPGPQASDCLALKMKNTHAPPVTVQRHHGLHALQVNVQFHHGLHALQVGRTETEGHPRHFYRFWVNTDHEMPKPLLHVYTGCSQEKRSYTEGWTFHAFSESETNQLSIMGVYLKKYFLTGILLFLVALKWQPNVTRG